MRRGSVFRRCGNGHRYKSNSKSNSRRCPKCGSDRYTWCYIVDIARPGTGRKQRSASGFRTKDEAEDARNALLEEQRKGRYSKPSKITVGAYLEDWLRTAMVEGLSRATLEGYIKNHIAPRIGDILLQDLQTNDLRGFYAALFVDGHQRTGGALNVETVKKIHRLIKSALEAAVHEFIPSNPAQRAFDRPRSAAVCEASHVWTHEQLSTFLTGVAGRDDYALWRTIAMTGARRGEILGLKWSRVGADKIVLDQQHRKARGGVESDAPTKTRIPRSVILDQGTIDVLAAYRQKQARRLDALGFEQDGDSFVFDRGNGEPFYPDVISKRFRRITARLKLPDIKLKNLRHTHATILLGMRVNIKVVQERLGHASATTTLKYYAFAIPGMDGEAADALGELVRTLGTPPKPSTWRSGGSGPSIDDLREGSLARKAVDQVLESTRGAKTKSKLIVHGLNKFLGFCEASEIDPESATLETVDGPYVEWLRDTGLSGGSVSSLPVYARKYVRALQAMSDVADSLP